jgi:hypothetical protein
MENKILKKEYYKRNLLLRIVPSRSGTKYRISSYDYLPYFPTLTIFSRDRILNIDKTAGEMKEYCKDLPKIN